MIPSASKEQYMLKVCISCYQRPVCPSLLATTTTKKVSGSKLIDCFPSVLTQSKTKHQENLAVIVKFKNKNTLKTIDIGKILNHYNIVRGEKKDVLL